MQGYSYSFIGTKRIALTDHSDLEIQKPHQKFLLRLFSVREEIES